MVIQRDSEVNYNHEQDIKYRNVYNATIIYLSNHSIGVSWDSEYYRVTDENIMLDSKYKTREDAYVSALILAGRKTHRLEPKYIPKERG